MILPEDSISSSALFLIESKNSFSVLERGVTVSLDTEGVTVD